PTAQMRPVNAIEDKTRNRRAENAGNRYTRHKEGNRVRLFTLREPIGQKKNNAGKITSFRKAEEKTCRVQLISRRYKAGQHRYYSPADEDSRDPNPRADLVKK